LADFGDDKIENVIALCPNCHREAHHGENKERIYKEMLLTVEKVEKRQ
jgi:5-methylcytosine-specific restriction protein A